MSYFDLKILQTLSNDFQYTYNKNSFPTRIKINIALSGKVHKYSLSK